MSDFKLHQQTIKENHRLRQQAETWKETAARCANDCLTLQEDNDNLKAERKNLMENCQVAGLELWMKDNASLRAELDEAIHITTLIVTYNLIK